MIARSAAFALCALVLSACSEPNAQSAAGGSQPDVPVGSGFDFYVLALSWSPGYCASEGERANQQQCGSDQDFNFVVHGLWPQFNDGWPEFCETSEPRRVDRQLSDAMLDIMPSTGLVRHQWRKHGTCSGLSQEDYFAVTRAAYEQIVIPSGFQGRKTTERSEPSMVEGAFLDANPAIPADAIAVTCDRRFLRE